MTKRAITNTHDQLVATEGGIAIVPAHTPSRTRSKCGWAVYRVDAEGRAYVTAHKDAAWYDYGRMSFCSDRTPGFAADLVRAQRWIAAQYGEVGPWVRNRIGDYVPARVQKAAPLTPRPRLKKKAP